MISMHTQCIVWCVHCLQTKRTYLWYSASSLNSSRHLFVYCFYVPITTLLLHTQNLMVGFPWGLAWCYLFSLVCYIKFLQHGFRVFFFYGFSFYDKMMAGSDIWQCWSSHRIHHILHFLVFIPPLLGIHLHSPCYYTRTQIAWNI